MENIMKPEPHKIIHVLRQTAAEFTIRVACDKDPGYGQFFQLSLPKIGEAPISVCGKGPGYVEFRKVGRLTGGVFDLKAGDTLFMRGPYGNAFPVEQFENKNLVVICGGTGMSPVKTTLTHFYDHPEICKSVYLIAGFKDINCVLFDEERAKFAEKFHCTYYNVVIVGPPPMMRFAALECMKCGVPPEKIWVSFERKMSCAVGKCGHCKINETYVCLEGPVFNYTKAKELFD